MREKKRNGCMLCTCRRKREDCIEFDMKWADPGGTAIPGQPVARAEQAPDISPLTKNQFNIVVPM